MLRICRGFSFGRNIRNSVVNSSAPSSWFFISDNGRFCTLRKVIVNFINVFVEYCSLSLPYNVHWQHSSQTLHQLDYGLKSYLVAMTIWRCLTLVDIQQIVVQYRQTAIEKNLQILLLVLPGVILTISCSPIYCWVAYINAY